MTTGLGFNGGLLAFGKETAYGTAVARTNLICINSDGLAVEEESIISECLNADFTDIEDMYRGNVNAGGDIEYEMRYEGSELLIENLLGTKTTAEQAAYVIDATNNKIDFTEDGGAELTATLSSSTYILGASSATAGTLCAEIKTALEAAGAGTYTVAYSRTTKKITISVATGASAVVFLFGSGTNKLVSPCLDLGYAASDTVSGASAVAANTIESVFKHSFKRSADTDDLQAGLTMELLMDGNLATAKSRLYEGCMLNSMDFSIEAGGKLMASMNVLAEDESLLDTETVSALTYDKKPIALAKQGVLSYGGSTETAVVSAFSCTLGMNLKDDRYGIGSNLRKKPLPNGKMEITGTMSVEFEGKTKYDDFRNNTSKAIAITFTSVDMIVGAVPYAITFSFPTTKLQGATPQVSDSGLVSVEIPFTAGGVDVNNKGVVVELTNSIYLA
jgi:hypothetical protein